MKSTEDQDSSDIVFDEVMKRPLATPEVGIFPDGQSVHPSVDKLNLSLEEETGKVDEIPLLDSEKPPQTEKNSDFKNQDSSTPKIDIDDN